MQPQSGGIGGQNPAELIRMFQGMNFPADKDDLVRHAESRSADSGVMDMLRSIPPGAYDSIGQVMDRLGVPSGVTDALKGFGKPH